MTFDIKPATPDHQPIILGLTGPSGSGKTLSALLLAHGIRDVVGGEVGVIDTEGRRALRYADKTKFPDFNFRHLEFQPPFSSDRYAEAIQAFANTAGIKTIVVDSMSHEHEGPGGYLEYHEKEIDRMLGDKKNSYSERKKMTFTGWIAPAAARRRLINSFLQVPLNFIFCFRAKEKLKIISGAQPKALGWQAIAGDEFVYEMIVRALLPPGSQGVPDWSQEAFEHGAAKRDAQDAHIFPSGGQITRAMGQALAKAYGGAGAQPRQTPGSAETKRDETDIEQLKREGMEAAEGGLSPLQGWFKLLTREQQAALKPYLDATLKPIALDVDAPMQESA
jgi:hypothetical protein